MTERAEQFDEADRRDDVIRDQGGTDDPSSDALTSVTAAESTVSDDDAPLQDDEATGEDTIPGERAARVESSDG